jgi:hypothetical protein
MTQAKGVDGAQPICMGHGVLEQSLYEARDGLSTCDSCVNRLNRRESRTRDKPASGLGGVCDAVRRPHGRS